MTTAIIEKDIALMKEQSEAFPKRLHNETLEYIRDSEAGVFYRHRADQELVIRKTGIALVAVAEDVPDGYKEHVGREELEKTQEQEGRRPEFVYSVGMSRIEEPEMLTFYKSASSSHYVLNEIHQRILKGEVEAPRTLEDCVEVKGIFEDESLSIFLTLLSKSEAAWAHESITCQVDSEDTPVMLVHIPLPSGEMPWQWIPKELAPFVS